MGNLMNNRTNLYRYNGLLLRSPITVELTADNFAYYVVAGHYDKTHLPDQGFQLQATYDNTMQVEYLCNSNYLSPSDTRQIWRSTTINPVPTCWYGGAYATSAPTMSGAYTTSESCIWYGAVHFSCPRGVTISSAYTSIRNYGVIDCYGSAGAGSTRNTIWNDPDGMYWGVAGVGSLVSPTQMNISAVRLTWNAMADSGVPRSYFDLWKFGASNRDGAIPSLAAPINHRFNLTAAMLQTMSTNGGIWMATTFGSTIWSSTNFEPMYVEDDVGTWGCFATSVSNKMTVVIE